MSNNHPFDDDTKRDLDAVGRAYRDARKREDELPPAALDDALRAAARRAVSAGPQPVSKNWLRRWTPPLAVAAVVVLSVSVVFVAVDEHPELAPAPVQKITLARQVEKSSASMANAPPATLSGAESDHAAQRVPPPTKLKDSARAKRADPTDASGISFVPPPEAKIAGPSMESIKKEDRGGLDTAGKTTVAAGQSLAPPVYAPAPASMAPAAGNAAAPSQTPFPAAETSSRARSEARVDSEVTAIAEAKKLRLAEKTALAGAVSTEDVNTIAPKPAAAPAPTVAASATPPAPANVARAPLLKQSASAESSGQLRDQTPAMAPTDALTKDLRPGPWLKRLHELQEQKKWKELREELAQFQKAHPSVMLPKTLVSLPAK